MSDLIDRQAALDIYDDYNVAVENGELESYRRYRKQMLELPSAQPGCEDAVPRASVEYICRKNTVSTNPYEHKYHDKFIQFMDDPEISDFGRWQHSNGFNTALVAVRCDLDKVPSVTPKQPGWIPCSTELPKESGEYQVTVQYDNDDYDVVIYEYNAYRKEWNDGDLYSGIVMAWQPKPKPWERGQE